MDSTPRPPRLVRQESEVELELRLALEEACLEVGVLLSSDVSHKALLHKVEPVSVSVDDLAKWLARTRTLRSLRKNELQILDDIYGTQTESLTLGDSENETFSVYKRLQNANEYDISQSHMRWEDLSALHGNEHAVSDGIEENNACEALESFLYMDPHWQGCSIHGLLPLMDDVKDQCLQVTINSGGLVYFALFRKCPTENGEQSESAACLKFTTSRLTTQSERLGYEIARHLGIVTPQARVVHCSSAEWASIIAATERARDCASDCGDLIEEKTCNELLEAMNLSRSLLLMGFISGKPLLECPEAFDTQKAAEHTAAALGRILLLDLVLRNEDRLVCRQLGWRGNSKNLLCSRKKPIMHPIQQKKDEWSAPRLRSPHKQTRGLHISKRAHSVANFNINEEVAESHADFHIVAIDSGVPRRPPAGKRESDKVQYPRFVEMLLNDMGIASEILWEISGGNLGTCDSAQSNQREPSKDAVQCIDQSRVVRCFKAGFVAGLKKMHALHLFLLKLYRTLDHLLHEFVVDIHDALPVELSPEKTPSPKTDRTPMFMQQDGHGSSEKHSPGSAQSPRLERRLTLTLKGVNKMAKVDGGIHDRLESWDKRLSLEGQKLCDNEGFITGFLDGNCSHSLVDSYELKIRLEHLLERIALISEGADTESPSRVIENLYIGGAIAAKSILTLQRLGITHILCLCPSELAPVQEDDFQYKCFKVQDTEDADIASHFAGACNFISSARMNGGKVLVHCFEGKSRSATIILVYLMQSEGMTLLEAWTTLKRSHARAQPNDGFMRTLVAYEKNLFGKASIDWQQKRPIMRVCPICGKNVGVSNDSLIHHLNRVHPGTHEHDVVPRCNSARFP